MKATILGGGVYGVTLAWLAAKGGHSIVLRTSREEHAGELIKSRTFSGAPGVKLQDSIHITSDLDEALANELLILAVPPRAARKFLRAVAASIRPEHVIVHVAKGYDDLARPVSRAIEEETCAIRTGVIGGPLVPRELWAGEDTAAVVASRFQSVVDAVTALLTSDHLRVYGSLDLVGVELGGALRTPVALASGMLRGVGRGAASAAVLQTRAIVEGSRLALALGGQPESLSGLSGIGDWMVVAADANDEVVQAGLRLTRGESLGHEEAESRTRALHQLARQHGVEMPVVDGVVRVLDGEPMATVLAELMSREARPEWDGVAKVRS
ncbi:MAG: glycerol-3-phosphate dehydrogenase (NAD(P)+) [Bradymonadia bacterium]|jgi:glycerol-3-phosphate dehydrogenase (NAD(P)+)